MIRRAAEILSHNKSFLRKLPQEFGGTSFYVSPDAQLKYLRPGRKGFDIELLEVAKRFIGLDDFVWDIGANVGVFTFAAATLAGNGNVLAIEADIWLANLIRKSSKLERNACLNIDVLPVAISSEAGIASFSIAARGRASNHLKAVQGSTQTGGSRDLVYVPTLTLDNMLSRFSPPTFVKIDIEGAEALALAGAERLLSEVRPVFYMEVTSENRDMVSQIMLHNGYLFMDPMKLEMIGTPIRDTLFVPTGHRFLRQFNIEQ